MTQHLDAINNPHVIQLKPAPFKSIVALGDEETPVTHLRVLECYLADGQGEGMWTGAPTVFLRLSGCTVGCSYCDTKYSWATAGGAWMSVEDAWRKVDEAGNGVNNVVLTGGEPMEHPLDLVNRLLVKLVDEGMRVTVETSGTVIPNENEWGRWQLGQTVDKDEQYFPILWSVAPKLKAAKSRFRVTPTTIFNWITFAHKTGSQLQFKWVCRTIHDVDEAMEYMVPLVHLYPHVRPFPVYIQPVTDTTLDDDSMKLELLNLTRDLQSYVANACLPAMALSNLGIQVMVRPQLHALIHGNKRLV